MNNPVLVEVTRGGQVDSLVESRHRGAFVVVDESGSVVLALGDVDHPVFPRSAVKALQALPMIASGAADRFGISDAEIALACASHSGEEAHVAAAAGMLGKLGRDHGCLECGSHWPMDQKAQRALAAAGGEPSALHNNCSGKHSGFVCLACDAGVDPAGYVRPDHPVQERVRGALSEVTGAQHAPEDAGVDGCSIPTYPTPLVALARGFARFATGAKMPSDFARAAQRIRRAVAAHPFMVAGSGRFDTRMMEALGDKVFMKTGAEGVYCAAIPERGYGIALKIDDGAGRAAEVVMAELVRRFASLSESQQALVEEACAPPVKNWNRIEVGRLRPAGALARS